LTGSASRFLDYDINPYATGKRYQIESSGSTGPREQVAREPHDSRNTASSHPFLSSQHTDLPSSSLHEGGQLQNTGAQDSLKKQTHDETYRLTIIGCVRFLDHSGHLYGNRLSWDAKKKSDAALKAVLRAFALQWLPISGSRSEAWISRDDLSIAKLHDGRSENELSIALYTDVWHQARSHVNAAKGVRSFRVVFATLMFDGIAVPMSARTGSDQKIIENEYLNEGLQKIQELDKLICNHCHVLGPLSKYGTLTEVSLSLVRWSAYIRDTGAALTSSHQCRLPEFFANEDCRFGAEHMEDGRIHMLTEVSISRWW
jgi:hypothetical protein